MSHIIDLITTPEIGIGIGLIVLACAGLSLVAYISRGRAIASITKERDELRATANQLQVQLAGEQAAYNKAAGLVVEVNNKGARLEAVLIEFYEVIVNEAKRRGMFAGEATSKAYREAYNAGFKEMTIDTILLIFSDVKWIAEQMMRTTAEDHRRLEAHKDRIHEETQWALARISYGGCVLEEMDKDLSQETKTALEKHIHFDQVNALIKLSTVCHYLKMSTEAYALELDKIIERDRHVLRSFLELAPHIIHGYPEDYIRAVRRLAS